jgi:hypothetical protein
LRLAFFGFSAASTFVAALISAAKLIQVHQTRKYFNRHNIMYNMYETSSIALK